MFNSSYVGVAAPFLPVIAQSPSGRVVAHSVLVSRAPADVRIYKRTEAEARVPPHAEPGLGRCGCGAWQRFLVTRRRRGGGGGACVRFAFVGLALSAAFLGWLEGRRRECSTFFFFFSPSGAGAAFAFWFATICCFPRDYVRRVTEASCRYLRAFLLLRSGFRLIFGPRRDYCCSTFHRAPSRVCGSDRFMLCFCLCVCFVLFWFLWCVVWFALLCCVLSPPPPLGQTPPLAPNPSYKTRHPLPPLPSSSRPRHPGGWRWGGVE
jgi:hypothetical protein